tara:strand:- start:409 stop:546 length:138 start_codon:yes stop_codon:yes gene_type:complete
MKRGVLFLLAENKIIVQTLGKKYPKRDNRLNIIDGMVDKHEFCTS